MNKIAEIVMCVVSFLRRVIDEESDSLDRFYAQYE